MFSLHSRRAFAEKLIGFLPEARMFFEKNIRVSSGVLVCFFRKACMDVSKNRRICEEKAINI